MCWRGCGKCVGVYSYGTQVGALYADKAASPTGHLFVKGPKSQKNFVVDHPDQPGKVLVYTSLEGPEGGMYTRGTASLSKGKAVVELPWHFAHLAAAKGMTATPTPRSASSRGLAAVELNPRRLVVRELRHGKGGYEFDYVIHAVRDGHQDYRVVRDWSEFEAM